MTIRTIDKNIETVPTWGDDDFDANVHENFTSLKEIVPKINNSINDMNVVIEDLTSKIGTVDDSVITVTNAKTDAVAAAEIAVIAKNEAQAIYDNFDDRYLGPFLTPPILDNDGEPLKNGALYYLYTESPDDKGKMYIYDLQRAEWIDISYIPTLFSNLTDILLAGLETDDILKYDKTLGKWKNIPRDYYDKTESDNKFDEKAELVGSATQKFEVADGVADNDAVNKKQLDTKVNTTNVYNKTELDLKISYQQFDKPLRGPLFIKVSPSSIKIPAGLKLTVGTTSFKVITDYTLSLATNLLIPETKTAGTDYFVYAKSDATFYISSNENITTDRKIGGFHYGLVGESEAVTGNKLEADMVKIRGINQYSFWDLKWKPVANPKGMVNIGYRWYDIYLLNSEHITNGTSRAGLWIAGGAATYGRVIPKIPLEYGGNNTINYGKFTWFQACEIAKAHGKELISYAEFPTIAYGVTEMVSSLTNGYETVAGKIEHYPNLTSKYGIEQAVGTEWIWGSDVQGIGGAAWITGVTDGRGDIYAPASSPTAVILGGNRGDGVAAGSRASHWTDYVWYSVWSIGCRFACDHLELE
jgi:hypothetical protein